MKQITITKHGNKYQAFVYNKYTKKRITVSSEDKDLCRLKAEELRYDIKTNPNKYLDEKSIAKSKNKLNQTVEDAFNFWIDNKNDCIEDTKEDYRGIFKNHLQTISKIKLKDLDDNVIQILYTSILKGETALRKKDNKDYTNTLLRVHSCLRGFINYLYKKKIISTNYMDFVTIPKKQKIKHTRCSINEYKEILKLAKNENTELPYLYILILITSCIGLRIGEALGIDINNINFEDGYIDITQQVNFRKGQGYIVVKDLKNSSSKRKAPIANLVFVQSELKKYMIQREMYIKKCRKINPDFAKEYETLLFINEKGGLIPTNTVNRYWREFKNNNNINPNIRIHDFRRFFATLLLENEVPDKISSEALGHSNIDMTKYYQNLDIKLSCRIINDVKWEA